MELILAVNWLAVILSSAAAFMVGGLWYSPKMFQKKWMEGSHITDTQSGDHAKKAMSTQAIGTFLLAWVVGVIMMVGSHAVAIILSLAIAFLIKAGGHFSQKTCYATFVDAGFVLLMVLVMVLIQGLFGVDNIITM